MGRRNFYVVRLRKTDQVVAVGTSDECTAQLGFKSRKTFYSILSKNRSGQRNRYEVDVVPEDEEEENC